MSEAPAADSKLRHNCDLPSRITSKLQLLEAIRHLGTLLTTPTSDQTLDLIRKRVKAERYVLPPGILYLRLLHTDVLVGNSESTRRLTGQNVPNAKHGSFVLVHRFGLNLDNPTDGSVYMGLSLPNLYEPHPAPLAIRATIDTIEQGRLRFLGERKTIERLRPPIDPFVLVGGRAAEFMPQITTPPPGEV